MYAAIFGVVATVLSLIGMGVYGMTSYATTAMIIAALSAGVAVDKSAGLGALSMARPGNWPLNQTAGASD